MITYRLVHTGVMERLTSELTPMITYRLVHTGVMER